MENLSNSIEMYYVYQLKVNLKSGLNSSMLEQLLHPRRKTKVNPGIGVLVGFMVTLMILSIS